MTSNASREHTYGKDGIDGAAVGRTIGLSALVLGIGALLFSWIPIVGSVFGGVAAILGVVAVIKALGAKKRVAAAGREPRTAGAIGLGTIGIITGIIAIGINVAILMVAHNAIDKCNHLDPGTTAYQQCISDVTGLDKPK